MTKTQADRDARVQRDTIAELKSMARDRYYDDETELASAYLAAHPRIRRQLAGCYEWITSAARSVLQQQ